MPPPSPPPVHSYTAQTAAFDATIIISSAIQTQSMSLYDDCNLAASFRSTISATLDCLSTSYYWLLHTAMYITNHLTDMPHMLVGNSMNKSDMRLYCNFWSLCRCIDCLHMTDYWLIHYRSVHRCAYTMSLISLYRLNVDWCQPYRLHVTHTHYTPTSTTS